MSNIATQVGIMADSHGDAVCIDRAYHLLAERGCDPICHLGDVCDSTRPETIEACVDLIVAKNILAIKGNNDHSLGTALSGQREPSVPLHIVQWLNTMPLIYKFGRATFVHSLPFVQQRGLSAMVGVMGKKEAARFFDSHPDGICFRGHSHNPELIQREPKEGGIGFQALSVGDKFELAPRLPAVITCGALSEGICMVWHPVTDVIEVLEF